MGVVFTDEYKRLYLRSWDYNAALLMNELERIVIANGGKVKPAIRKAVISNRNLDDAIEDYKQKLEKYTELEKVDPKPIRADAIKSLVAALQELETIDNRPREVTRLTYINFVLGDYVYYYQVDNNPFFEFYFHKIKVVDGSFSKSVYLDEDNKSWMKDCFLSYACSKDEIKKAASNIFNMLLSAKPSRTYFKTEKIKVKNTYDDGFHYENVPKLGRMEKIDY